MGPAATSSLKGNTTSGNTDSTTGIRKQRDLHTIMCSHCDKRTVTLKELNTYLPSAMKLRRLCFNRCVSVHRWGGGVCFSACWDTTPQEQTPPSRHSPEQTSPLEQTPPKADTPQSRHPSG